MEMRGRLIAIGVALAIFGPCFCWIKRSQDKAVEQLANAEHESSQSRENILQPPEDAASLAYREEQRLYEVARKDPHAAVKEVRALLAAHDAGTPMATTVQRLLPRFLMDDLRASVKSHRYEDADDTLLELEKVATDDDLAKAKKLLENASADRIWTAVTQLDDAKAEAMLEQELVKRGTLSVDPSRDSPRRLAERRLKKWDEAGRPLSGPGLDDLETAAQLTIRTAHQNPVVEALSKPGARSLVDRCRALEASERLASAALCWTAAKSEVKPPAAYGTAESKVYDARMRQLDDARMKATLKLMDSVASNGSRWIPPRLAFDAGDFLLNDAISRIDLARRSKEPEKPWQDFQREVVMLRIRLLVADGKRQLAQKDPSATLLTLDRIFRGEAGWLYGVKLTEGWDPWSGAPDEVKKAVDPEGRLTPNDRSVRLRQQVEQGKWRPDWPELMAAHNLTAKARIEWGLSQLDDGDKARRELGEELLRGVLRESLQPSDAAAVVAALQERLRKVGGASDFSRLLELGSFYAAEVALQNSKDPFRDELKGLLTTAAEHYRSSEGLERLFLLTLIADLFPADEEGRKAREESLATFFSALDRARAQPSADPSKLPPSGLAGLSVTAVENATSHHLLLFYDGTERFFVRVAPRRRGSVVFKDGQYKHGAVVTDAKIIPARGEPNYQSKFLEARYRIVTERGGRISEDASRYAAPLGNYPLLRAPEGEQLKVDAESGRVSRL